MRVSSWPRILVFAVVLSATWQGHAAPPDKKTGSTGKPAPPAKSPALPAPRAIPKAEPARELPSYKTPPDVISRLGKILPHALVKLRKHDPLHICVIGDEVTGMEGHGPDAGNRLLAWPAQLAAEFAREFYYAGGVRMLMAGRGKPDKLVPISGPEITMRVLDMDDATADKAVPALLALGLNPPPDVIIVSVGTRDAMLGGDLMTFAKHVHDLIETVRPKAVDMILAAPPPPADDPAEQSIAAMRPFAGVMRDLAEENRVAFVDLGDLSLAVRLDEDAPASPADNFQTAVRRYRDHFKWPGGVHDLRHPLPSLHERLGAGAFRQLCGTDDPPAWSIDTKGAAVDDAGALRVTFGITSLGTQAARILLQPMPLSAWTPADAPAYVDLPAGGVQTITLTWNRARVADAFQFPAFSSHEPFVRLPLFVASGTAVRIEELRAQPGPVALLSRTDALFNQQDSFTLENMLVNTSGAELTKAQWTAEWAGQSHSGTLDMAAGATAAVPLSFQLPKDRGARRIASPLVFTASAGGRSLTWTRAMEASQNIGLDQEISLPSTGEASGNTVLRASADKQALTLTFDMEGVSRAPVLAEIELDARSYGQRLAPGGCHPITFSIGSDDKEVVAGPVAPWAFGNGYGMHFDERALVASQSLDVRGHRLVKITVPRSYLYLHEWAIGNGNSQIGINARLILRGQVAGRDTIFALTQNGRRRDDTESMAVLELTDKPTARWSVVIW